MSQAPYGPHSKIRLLTLRANMIVVSDKRSSLFGTLGSYEKKVYNICSEICVIRIFATAINYEL